MVRIGFLTAGLTAAMNLTACMSQPPYLMVRSDFDFLVPPAVRADLDDSLSRQIKRCWVVDERASMYTGIRVRIEIGRDRRIQSIDFLPPIQPYHVPEDPRIALASEGIRRALQDPQCQPFRLPDDRYDIWKSVVLYFVPATPRR